MHPFAVVPPARFGAVLAAVAGVVAGVAAVGLAGGESGARTAGSEPGVARLEVSHLPPLLTTSGERVRLSFDAFCIPPETAAPLDGAPCDASGSVFLRPGTTGPYTELPLTASGTDTGAARGLETDVPDDLAHSPSGFSYYAVVRSVGSDTAVTIPSGGADAPLVSRPLGQPVEVDLGRHAFGRARAPDARVAHASWGAGPSDVGLESSRRSSPVGASAFAVDAAGTVYLLDETHHRILRWRKGAQAPGRVPVSVAGTLADMTVASDGTIYVLETVGDHGRAPLVRRFDGDGRELEAVETADSRSAEIEPGPDGPIVFEQPSMQWMPVVVHGVAADKTDQRSHARTARPLRGGGDVTVLRSGNEIRVAVRGPHGVRRTWDVTSDTDIAEVQLAESLGSRAVVVARVYTDAKDEFVVLVLGPRGLEHQFSLEPDDWAESAPLGRFELAGSSLYRLGTTPEQAFVDRFDLEVG